MRFVYSLSHTIISLVLICLILLTNANTNDKEVGDECQITRTGKPGTCQFTLQCSEVKDDLRLRATLPTVCGYKGFKQIVCCPIKEPEEVVPVLRSDFPNVPIAVRKCKEYSKYAFRSFTVPSFDPGMNAITKRIDHCGHTSIPLIVDGTPAAAREFPHSAVLGYMKSDREISWDCGGTLVSTRYVLTAGHCLKSPRYDVNASLVRLGELVLYDDTDESEVIDIPIERIIPHPEYTKATRYNDIALLKLNHKVVLSPFIRPICLPTENLVPHKLLATGWGIIAFGGLRSNALLKVVLDSYSNEECKRRFEDNEDRKLRKGIIETQFCAGSRNDSKDACEGDSGGPLQVYHPDTYCMYTQVGVTSFGIGCGTINFPGVYTRVYEYKQWIESIIWATDEDD